MRALWILVVLALIPSATSAATVEQIVALSKAGVSEPVILVYIDRDKSVFTIDPDTLVKLKTEGVSERVVLAMLNSGRAEADAAMRADQAARLEAYMATGAMAPSSINIGHGPERPNSGELEGYAVAPALPFGGDYTPVPYALPYAAPYGPVVVAPYGAPFVARRPIHGSRRTAVPISGASCLPPATGGAARSRAILSGCTQPVQSGAKIR